MGGVPDLPDWSRLSSLRKRMVRAAMERWHGRPQIVIRQRRKHPAPSGLSGEEERGVSRETERRLQGVFARADQTDEGKGGDDGTAKSGSASSVKGSTDSAQIPIGGVLVEDGGGSTNLYSDPD